MTTIDITIPDTVAVEAESILREAELDAPGEPEITDQSWRGQSACRGMDPDLFFSGGGASHKAKKVCGDCPVRELCLEMALRNDERFGIWGGTTREERAQLKRRMKQRSARPAA